MTSTQPSTQPNHECEFCGSTNTRVLAAIDYTSDGAVLAVLCGCSDCSCAFTVEFDGPIQSNGDDC